MEVSFPPFFFSPIANNCFQGSAGFTVLKNYDWEQELSDKSDFFTYVFPSYLLKSVSLWKSISKQFGASVPVV